MYYEAFVYRWRESTTKRWYIGCHKGTVDDGYICGNKNVKEWVKKDPTNWQRKILRFGTHANMLVLERKLLVKLKAPKNTNSYNKSLNNTVSPGRPSLGKQTVKTGTYYANKTTTRGGARPGAGRPKGSKDKPKMSRLMNRLLEYDIEFNTNIDPDALCEDYKIVFVKK